MNQTSTVDKIQQTEAETLTRAAAPILSTINTNSKELKHVAVIFSTGQSSVAEDIADGALVCVTTGGLKPLYGQRQQGREGYWALSTAITYAANR